MLWFRIDNRLVHGQIIEAWLPHIRAKTLLVANDELAADDLRQEIMSLAVPSGITFLCCTVSEAPAILQRVRRDDPDQHVLVLSPTAPMPEQRIKTGLPLLWSTSAICITDPERNRCAST